MNPEKIILSFIAVLFGLFVAGIGFYVYQSTKVVSPQSVRKITLIPPTATPSPLPKANITLIIDNPPDESVTDTKTLTLNGKTNTDATLVISTGTNDQVITPTKTGDFSTTLTLEDGENKITVDAIAPNGEDVTKTVTVTYSTESF